jgi:GTP pyrophosphokinase
LEIFDTSTSPKEILSHTRREMFVRGIFCFTPDGDLISLPEGATAVDFAYAIHTNIGDSCIGVRIDGYLMPLWTVLQNGTSIEIITDPHQRPSPLWDKFVVTGKAKAHIRKFVRAQEKKEFSRLGQALLRQQLAQFEWEDTRTGILSKLAKDFGYSSLRSFQEAVGRGRVPYALLKQKMEPLKGSLRTAVEVPPVRLSDFTSGIAVHYAECCHPIAQNSVVGQLTPDHGLIVHTLHCLHGKEGSSTPIPTVWGGEVPDQRICTHLQITILNQLGSFAIVFNLLKDLEIRVTHISIAYRSVELINVIAEIQMEQEEQLAEAFASLRTCPRVRRVEEQK